MTAFEKPRHVYPNLEKAVQEYQRIISSVRDGKVNSVIDSTLNTSTASTTISSVFCTTESHISITPESLDALSAMPSVYVKSKTSGSFILAHGSTGTTQSYSLSIAILG